VVEVMEEASPSNEDGEVEVVQSGDESDSE
jgi:hypothetical protein